MADFNDIDSVIQEISEIAGCSFGPASLDDLKAFKGIGAPSSIVDFYMRFEPKDAIIIGVENHSIHTILEKTKRPSLSSTLLNKGFLHFASDDGLLCCFDLNKSPLSPRIVLINHECVNFLHDGHLSPGCLIVASHITEYWHNTLAGVKQAQSEGYFD